jgi:EmrB/QacA subfamily drug resistance transporter
MTSSPRAPLLLACGASFLAFLDVTITNLAIPDLAGDFDAGVSSLSWVVTLYTILFAALLAPAGRFADLVGRRRLFAAGVTTFTLASAAAALAPSLGLLLAARGVQGVGAAMLLPASLAFVLADTAPEKRPAAIGLWAASASIAAIAGPALGGILVDATGWRALFLINVPLGVALVYGTVRLPAVAATKGRRPDVFGAALLAAGVAALVLAVTQADAWGYTDPRTLGAFAAAALLLAAALIRAARIPAPAIEISLWRNRTYAAANLVSLLFGAGLYATLLLGVLFVTEVWGWSELQAGFSVTPGALASALVGIAIGRAQRRPSPRALVIAGGLTLAASTAAIAIWLPETPSFLSFWLPLGMTMGLGMGAISVGVSSAAALSVTPERFAAATGLNIAARQVGGALGVAFLALALDGHTPGDTGPFSLVYAMTATVSLAVALAAIRLAPVKARAQGQVAAARA